MLFGKTTPIFRIFDEAKAREFYVGFLGFTIDWEHRPTSGHPVYLQISLDGCLVHLSEHHGDCSPGAQVRIEVADVDRFQADLAAKGYPYVWAGIETPPWGTREMTLTDPFLNRLTFFTDTSSAR